MSRIRNGLRNLLRVRKDRAAPPEGPKPIPGARIVSGTQRMVVQSGMTDEMWDWLKSMGWREEKFKPDRRRYDDISRDWVMRLYRTDPSDRMRVLRGAVAAAQGRNPTHPDVF